MFRKNLYKSNDWVESSLDFSPNCKGSLPRTKNYLGFGITKSRYFVVLVLIFIIFSILIFRLFQVQIVKGSDYLTFAERNRQRVVPIPAERGQIYDRNGVQLTKNIPNFSLALRPQELPRSAEQRAKIVERLASLTKQSPDEISDLLEKFGSYSYESIVIQEGLDYDTALSIQIAASNLAGLEIQRGSKRLYALETQNFTDANLLSLSHVLGYQGKLTPEELDELYDKGYLPSDVIGRSGIERSYEKILRGSYGWKKAEVDAQSKTQAVLEEIAPTPGNHLKLSIDTNIQAALQKFLEDDLAALEKSKGVAIAMDPQNGNILALVNVPYFDNNDFSGGIDSEKYAEYINNDDKPLFNRAVGGSYPSGSTIKPAIAAAALEEGIINAATSFFSSGGIGVGVWFFPDWLAGGHGATNVKYSLAWSVNTFYYYIGGGHEKFVGLGVEKITDYLAKFGFAKKTGVDLPGENTGFLPSKQWKQDVKQERWYIGDTYNLSIGQGDLLTTPLQIANLTAAIANGGILYTPKVVMSAIDPVKKEETKINPEILNKNFIASSHINTVKQGMRDCVVYGSCRRLAYLPVDISGKTGTAQWSSKKEPHAWFTSFAPYNNPEIVLTILIEEGDSGSRAAVPVAEKFYNWWWSYRNS